MIFGLQPWASPLSGPDFITMSTAGPVPTSVWSFLDPRASGDAYFRNRVGGSPFGGGWDGASNPAALPSHGFARRSKWSLVTKAGKVGFEIGQDTRSEVLYAAGGGKCDDRAVYRLSHRR